jgi:hypothetical protein
MGSQVRQTLAQEMDKGLSVWTVVNDLDDMYVFSQNYLASYQILVSPFRYFAADELKRPAVAI